MMTLTEHLVIKIINEEKEKSMNARELRIGNLINGSFDSPITVDYVKLMWLEKNDHEITASWKPIPLTESWLIKFGFKRISDTDDFRNGTVFLHKRKRGWVVNKRISVVQYVHQLQNLFFALTGKELTINQTNIKNDQ